MAARQLVLGAVTRLPLPMLRPFERSLRATGFDGTLNLVVGGYSEAEMRELASLADVVTRVDKDYLRPVGALVEPLARARVTRGLRRAYPFLFRLATNLGRGDPADRSMRLEFHLEGLQSLRYRHYLRVLEERDDVDSVMLTDVRDVLFQRNPFEDPISRLELALEDDAVRVGRDMFNTRWLVELFGSAFVQAASGQQISCSGTVLGPREPVLAYLRQMVAAISNRRRPMGPRDQAVHNALVLHDRVPGAVLVPNEKGRVLTMGAMTNARTNDDGVLVNADGTIPAVIHQWDRHGSLLPSLWVSRFIDEG